MFLPDNDAHYPRILTQLALAHRPPSKLITQTVPALPILCRMRSFFDPRDQRGKGSQPENGVDNVNDSVDVDIRKAAYALKNRKSRLVDESRYAAPTLR